MFKKLLLSLFIAFPCMIYAQEEAVTASGKTVLLFPDSTWKFKPEPVAVMSDSASTQPDSTSAPLPPPKPKKKEYTDEVTGFKGFLKPELKVPSLPEQAEGTYQFRVKINKEGFVKEITPVVVGPNSMAEKVMRDAILKMKFMPQGIPVPPLTEGMIKIVVPVRE